MNKKTLLSIALVLIVAVSAGVGTYAYFTATRTTNANRFVSGTLDLDVAANGNKLEPFVIENMGDNANIGGTKTWTIKNTGSLPGRLLVRLQSVVNEENGCNDQEANIEPACADDELGELGNVIVLNTSLDGTDLATTTLATADEALLGSRFSDLTPIILQADEEVEFTTTWAADENAYGNEIQSDSVQFDMNFRLIQQINGQQPAN